MLLIDKKFKTHKLNYVFQSILLSIAIFCILMILDIKTDAAVIAALGASGFIAFTMPHDDSSTPRKLIGGYIMGILSAGLFCLICKIPLIQQVLFFQNFSFVFFGSLSVGLAMFLMGITNTEHPPAASLALGLVFNCFNSHTVVIVLIGIISLCVIKMCLKPILKDLM